MNDSFWASRLAPAQPAEPTMPLANGEAYRAYQASKAANGASGSAVYTPEYQAALAGQHARPQRTIYVESDYSLANYQQAPSSKWARRADESDDSYLARTGAIIRAIDELPEAERVLIAQTRTEILERQQSGARDWDGHRALVDARATAGSGEQQLGHRVEQGQRFENRQIEKLGHLARSSINGANVASRSDIAAALRADEQNRQADYRAALATSSTAIADRIGYPR